MCQEFDMYFEYACVEIYKVESYLSFELNK